MQALDEKWGNAFLAIDAKEVSHYEWMLTTGARPRVSGGEVCQSRVAHLLLGRSAAAEVVSRHDQWTVVR